MKTSYIPRMNTNSSRDLKQHAFSIKNLTNLFTSIIITSLILVALIMGTELLVDEIEDMLMEAITLYILIAVLLYLYFINNNLNKPFISSLTLWFSASKSSLK